jgi:hypothetical protein
LLLLACDFAGRSKPDIGVETGMIEPDVDVDVDADSDVDGDGDAAIAVHLSAFSGEVDCAAAGLSELALTFRPDSLEESVDLTVPCDDAEVSWYGLPADSGVLSGRGDSTNGTFFEGSVEAEIAAGETAVIDLLLTCDDNGILDGCGGA